MVSVCEKYSWVIYQTYPETNFKLDDLIDYFMEIFTYGFAINDDNESDNMSQSTIDNMSEIENDDDSVSLQTDSLNFLNSSRLRNSI